MQSLEPDIPAEIIIILFIKGVFTQKDLLANFAVVINH